MKLIILINIIIIIILMNDLKPVWEQEQENPKNMKQV